MNSVETREGATYLGKLRNGLHLWMVGDTPWNNPSGNSFLSVAIGQWLRDVAASHTDSIVV